MVYPVNLRFSGIIYFINPWLIDLKLNTNWICVGTIIHLSKSFPCICHTRFQVLGVRNEISPVSANPNKVKLVQLLLIIDSKVSLPHTSLCKLYIRQFLHTETSGCCLHNHNEPQSILLQLITLLNRSKLSVCTDNTPLLVYEWLQKIEYYLSTMQQSIMFFSRMKIFFRGSIDKLQLHNYSRKSISIILDLTTIFRLSDGVQPKMPPSVSFSST